MFLYGCTVCRKPIFDDQELSVIDKRRRAHRGCLLGSTAPTPKRTGTVAKPWRRRRDSGPPCHRCGELLRSDDRVQTWSGPDFYHRGHFECIEPLRLAYEQDCQRARRPQRVPMKRPDPEETP